MFKKIMRIKVKVVVGLAMLGLVSIQAQASPADGLQHYVDNLVTFSADFEQSIPEGDFDSTDSTGFFKLKRPGRLVWEYTQPEPQQIMVDGVNIWIFDKDLDQVTVRGMDEVGKNFPFSWLLFDEPIKQDYDILYGGIERGIKWFNLSPKASTFFQSIDVGLKDGVMVEVHLYQSSDTVTKVVFKNIKTDTTLADDEFRFVGVDGIDIIGEPR